MCVCVVCVCACACLCVNVCLCMFVCKCVFVCVVYVCVCVCVCVHMTVYVCAYKCVRNCVRICVYACVCTYRIAGKFGEFGESSVICQTKTIQIFTYNYYLMAESIHSPNFSSPNVHNIEFAKLSPLYGISFI